MLSGELTMPRMERSGRAALYNRLEKESMHEEYPNRMYEWIALVTTLTPVRPRVELEQHGILFSTS